MEMSTRRACSLTETVTWSEGWGPAKTKDVRNTTTVTRMRDAPAIGMRMVSCGLQWWSNVFRHNIRCAIATTQETVGFLIANDLLLRGIESQRTPQTVRGIG